MATSRQTYNERNGIIRYWAIARDNKLTGERGVMGIVEIPADKAVIYERRPDLDIALWFPVRIASRARTFAIVHADSRQALISTFGPEID